MGGARYAIPEETKPISLDQTAKFDISLDELISRVCAKFEIRVKDLVSKSRKRYLSQARGVVCYLAVDELPCPVKLTIVIACRVK